MATAAKFNESVATGERDSDVKSVAKALDLLCCFTTERPEWGVTELADYLGLYKSAVHRLLATFLRLHFVERTPARRYRLGIRTAELGNMFQRNDQLIRVSERSLRVLAEETQTITHLTKLDGRDTVELLRFSATEPGLLGPRAAVRREAHATAKGKIFLAYVPDFFQRYVRHRSFLKQFTPMTIDTPDKLRLELAEIVKRGYAVDNEESRVGMRCIAVPIYMPAGMLLAALSVSHATESLPLEQIQRWVPRLERLAKAIGRSLGAAADGSAAVARLARTPDDALRNTRSKPARAAHAPS
jgi:DNA-binding IclR family transcriptional regulator